MTRRRSAVLFVGVVVGALVLAVAPVHCSLGSDDVAATCATVFGYTSPWP